MEMLTFCVKTRIFQLESDIPTARLSYGFTIVTSDGELVHGILWGNDFSQQYD